MKKIAYFAFLIMAMISIAGCGNNADNSNAVYSSSEKSTNISNKDDGVITGETEPEATKVEQEDRLEYLNWSNLKIYLPAWLEQEKDATYLLTYSGLNSTKDIIYYCYDSNEMYGDFGDYIENYSYTDVPQIFNDAVKRIVNDFYNYPSSITVDTEEIVECNQYPFIRQSGTMEAKMNDGMHELYYVAYFGCMNLEYIGGKSVPMMWIAFSETTDEKTKIDIAALVDTCAKEATFLEE